MKQPYPINFFLLIVLSLHFAGSVYGQPKLLLNGAKINIANGAILVISNPDTSAIIRYNGHIITEGEYNRIKWNIGTATGIYTIPLGYGTDYIPVTFTKTAGTGTGYFIFSTYHTGWNNSASLPTGVTNVNYNGMDNSPYTIDRFWKIDAAGYTTKPDLSNLTFTYLDAEYIAAGNSITENQLGTQRWNSTINDWGDFIPGVIVDAVNNKVTVATVNAGNLYKWWTLPSLNANHMLPVELTLFKGVCEDGIKQLSWTTASELLNDYFTLERSDDGVNWQTLKIIKGAGSSSRVINYSTTDETSNNKTYYRLQQTDFSGRSSYSTIIDISCSPMPADALQVYPNPSSGSITVRNVNGSMLQLINSGGDIVYTDKCSGDEMNINLPGIANGIYTLTANNYGSMQTIKLLIQH